MRRVIKGSGIKFLDEQVETAAFKILIGVYSHLVLLKDTYDLEEVLFAFSNYIFTEYQSLYTLLKKDSDASTTIEYRLKLLKDPMGKMCFISPSEILNDLDQIKKFKKLIQPVLVPCLPCIKLK